MKKAIAQNTHIYHDAYNNIYDFDTEWQSMLARVNVYTILYDLVEIVCALFT